jgi:hypothetical protein
MKKLLIAVFVLVQQKGMSNMYGINDCEEFIETELVDLFDEASSDYAARIRDLVEIMRKRVKKSTMQRVLLVSIAFTECPHD